MERESPRFRVSRPTAPYRWSGGVQVLAEPGLRLQRKRKRRPDAVRFGGGGPVDYAGNSETLVVDVTPHNTWEIRVYWQPGRTERVAARHTRIPRQSLVRPSPVLMSEAQATTAPRWPRSFPFSPPLWPDRIRCVATDASMDGILPSIWRRDPRESPSTGHFLHGFHPAPPECRVNWLVSKMSGPD